MLPHFLTTPAEDKNKKYCFVLMVVLNVYGFFCDGMLMSWMWWRCLCLESWNHKTIVGEECLVTCSRQTRQHVSQRLRFCSWFVELLSLNLCEMGLNLNRCVLSNVQCHSGYIIIFYFVKQCFPTIIIHFIKQLKEEVKKQVFPKDIF